VAWAVSGTAGLAKGPAARRAAAIAPPAAALGCCHAAGRSHGCAGSAWAAHAAAASTGTLPQGEALNPFGTGVVADAKGDQAIVIAEDALLGEHTTVEGAP
jgi:hypothetical protein